MAHLHGSIRRALRRVPRQRDEKNRAAGLASPHRPSDLGTEHQRDEKNRAAGLVSLLTGLVALGVFAGVNWLAVVAALVFTIFMHELGHYLTARWTGMKVTEFFLGFGPRIWSFHHGETEYGVKAFWAGAYVRIAGMNNLDEVEPADEDRSFRCQSYPRKLLVLTAGSGMHFVMGWALLFWVMLVDGSAVDADELSRRSDWTLATVSDHSAAADAGLIPGDELISVDGMPRGTFEDFGRHVSGSLKGTEVAVVYARDGVEHTATVRVGERLTRAGADGIDGLIAGDRILAVDGLPAEGGGAPGYAEVVQYASSQPGRVFDVTIMDVTTGEPMTVDGAVLTEIVDESEATSGFFGISAHYERRGLGPVAAADRTTIFIGRLARDVVGALPAVVVEGLGGMFRPSGDTGGGGMSMSRTTEPDRRGMSTTTAPDENRVLSIYGVARLGAESASEGMLIMFVLLTFVNIFIGVFNLLPIPPLDGGHIAVATYERLRSIGRAPYSIDAAKLVPLTYTVVVLLLLIGTIALARDILDPVSIG